MVAIGIAHFVDPEPFVSIVPPWLPAAYALVIISGLFEVLGGLGLIFERSRKISGYGLIALYLAVFPANLHMAVNEITTLGDSTVPLWAVYARLPFQFVFMAWAWWVSRGDD